MIKKDNLISILSNNEKTNQLVSNNQIMNVLIEKINQQQIIEFALYLEEKCKCRPTIIIDIIDQLFTNPLTRQILGNRLVKLWLLFKIYQIMDIHRDTKDNKIKRQNVLKVCQSFDFNGSTIKKLVVECWKAGEIILDSAQQIIQAIIEDRQQQVTRLFVLQNQSIEYPNHSKGFQEQLKDLILDYQYFPQNSFQKQLQKEIVLTYIQNHTQVFNKSKIVIFLPQYQNLKNCVSQLEEIYRKINGNIYSQQKGLLDKVRTIKDKQQLYINLCLIKSKIMSINVLQLQRLVNKTKNSEKCIQNKDVILFIGNTGSGKSTTILKFLGYTLQPGKMNKLSTLLPLESLAEQHKTFYTSPQAKSCTRYINSASIPSKMYNQEVPQQKRTVVLCDSPGFGDSAGIQVDIANGIGMINALHGSKSLRVAVILPYESITADRMTGIIKLSQMISKIFTSLKTLQSVIILFNKVPQQLIEQIPNLIENKIKNLNQLQISDQNLRVFLNQILNQSKQEQNFIDPFRTNYKILLDKILKMSPIINVSECIQYQFSYSTKREIQRYSQILKTKIKDDYNQIRLKEAQFNCMLLIKLKNILNNNQTINDDYLQICKFIELSSEKEIKNFQEQINTLISQNYNLTNIQKIKIGKKKMSSLLQFYTIFENIPKRSQQSIYEQIKEKMFKKYQIIQELTLESIKMIKVISDLFNLQLKKKISLNIQKKYKLLKEQILKKIKEKRYKEIGLNIQILNDLSKKAELINDKKSITISDYQLKELLKNHIEEGFKQIRAIQISVITEKKINQVKNRIRQLRQIESLKILDKNNQLLGRFAQQIKEIQSLCKKRIFELQKLSQSLMLQSQNKSFIRNQIVEKKKEIFLLMQLQDLKQRLLINYQSLLMKIN